MNIFLKGNKNLLFQSFSLRLNLIAFNKLNKNSFNSFYKTSSMFFAKKNDKNDKKQKEKETINKQYENVSLDQVKSKYKSSSSDVSSDFLAQLSEIQVQRTNPKILEGIQVKININSKGFN